MRHIIFIITFGLLVSSVLAQQPATDTVPIIIQDSLPGNIYQNKLDRFLNSDRFLHLSDAPVSMKAYPKQYSWYTEIFFYVIVFLVLLLASLKVFYKRYFDNLFRVFFNTSLRQNQLTDQLLQAKLPSLLFNIYFIITAGLYVYFVLQHFGFLKNFNVLYFILLSIAGLLFVYLLKFITLKFTGWIAGFREATDTYIFIVFLINKILGIFLLPFVVIMAFASPAIASPAVIISLVFTGIMFLLRFFRSYGLLQNRLKVSRFHFLLYLAGVEIIPILLIYKAVLLIIT